MDLRSMEEINQEYQNVCFQFGQKIYLAGVFGLDAFKIFKKMSELNAEAAEIQKAQPKQEAKESEAPVGKEATV